MGHSYMVYNYIRYNYIGHNYSGHAYICLYICLVDLCVRTRS